ncbi:hypothetical protein PBY51_011048 [Eleginops maclovinus]|nr:hypothetical protein PBY51_011048 [Eleginops maclovinus]
MRNLNPCDLGALTFSPGGRRGQPQQALSQEQESNCENTLIKLYTPPSPGPVPSVHTTTENAVKHTEDETMGSTFRGIQPPLRRCTLPGVCASVAHTAVKSSVKLKTLRHRR